VQEAEALGFETKFVLPAAAVPAARMLLAGTARPEQPYPAGSVESIYWDTPELASYNEKLSSDYLKTKLRLRWYDAGGAVHVEIKRRLGTRRAKERTVVGLDGAELSRGGLRAAGRWAASTLASSSGRPLDARLTPVLHLRYRRERFISAAGLRINLDTAIEVLETAPQLGGRHGSVAVPGAVLETKGVSRELPAALTALATVGCRRGSFSKYAVGLEAHLV
jgi:hypothetical protein